MTRNRVDVSPLAWAGQGLTRLGKAEWAAGLSQCLGVLALSAGIFAVALVASEQMYYRGWAGMQNRRQKVKTGRRSVEKAAGRGAALSAGPGGSLICVTGSFYLVGEAKKFFATAPALQP